MSALESEISDAALIARAVDATRRLSAVARERPDWKYMGCVGAALVTDRGSIFTGINVSLLCGIGFCAEHSAVAEMLRAGETRIARIAAATSEGRILPPCGRCRELLYQVDSANEETQVLMPNGRRRLGDLLPDNWQPYFGEPLTDEASPAARRPG